jgi:hypothetical protein
MQSRIASVIGEVEAGHVEQLESSASPALLGDLIDREPPAAVIGGAEVAIVLLSRSCEALSWGTLCLHVCVDGLLGRATA